ncbi:DUF2892 domain-containing protein [Stutzerimonas decontaminans]|jgi:hypothetical protein|uniref:DUF2892 domain-containing protein n=2 Tax=Stutzerimonas TaxID=2901164 RepID=A0ABX4W1W9_9GAMM|nr:DUF2892 domain-containing protein [Stutzerimonas decontaminans]AHY42195.1 hypothetical protein UIB01_06715 [Stutzerimonas decontaminans]MCQ4245987.1 DUF2892 domain-containing protein [Stutzerimonas decontaminans]PNF86462.1 DUF2892 domain-containing protein [Stutzerimonas decontaminans]
MALPSTVNRVPAHTDERVNQQIRMRTQRSVDYHRQNPQLIERRLAELDKEWDIERTLEANAATLIVAGSALGLTASRRFLAIPLVVGGFLLQHALQGWCPPLPVFRRLGIRTAAEIQAERSALEEIRDQA